MRTRNHEPWKDEIMGRNIGIRVPESLYRELVRAARRKGITLSRLTRILYYNYLDPGSIDM